MGKHRILAFFVYCFIKFSSYFKESIQTCSRWVIAMKSLGSNVVGAGFDALLVYNRNCEFNIGQAIQVWKNRKLGKHKLSSRFWRRTLQRISLAILVNGIVGFLTIKVDDVMLSIAADCHMCCFVLCVDFFFYSSPWIMLLLRHLVRITLFDAEKEGKKETVRCHIHR